MEIDHTLAAFQAAGLKINYKEMPNGEKRYSVTLPDASAGILTIAGQTGGWQNAHYHKGLKEFYQILDGQVAVAEDWGGANMHMSLLTAGDSLLLGARSHNLYLFPEAVVLTLKFGTPIGNPDKKENDWWPAEHLDQWSKSFKTVTAIMRQATGI